ncbi:UNVERIFIED_CONTAM: hypothetical protein GTU68_049278 [Idotea baltica]|nr:hypothetical protein [Idotea baltica]
MSVYDKASLYFFIHTLALFIIGILAEIKFLDLKQLNIVFYLLFFGIIIFSGSLYLLAILNVKWLGAITPIGGTLFIVSWLSLAFFTFKSKF